MSKHVCAPICVVFRLQYGGKLIKVHKGRAEDMKAPPLGWLRKRSMAALLEYSI